MDCLRKVLSNDVGIIALLSAVVCFAAIELDALPYFHELVADHGHTEDIVRHLGSLILVIITALLTFCTIKSREANGMHAQMDAALEEGQKALLKARKIARLDDLTELLNRKGFMDVLGESLSRGNRSQSKCAVLLVDMDRFKGVNEELGHSVGDQLLKDLGQRLRSNVRKTDYVSRLGSDVFGIVLNHISDYSGAGKVAKKLLHLMEEPFEVTPEGLIVSCSIGIAVAPQDSEDSLLMVQYADMALSQAKARGQNCYQFYTSLMQEEVQGKLALERDLKQAIRHNQLEAWFQPQFKLEPDQTDWF